MSKILMLPFILVFLICCTNNNQKFEAEVDNHISLKTDTINIVKLSDTLVIFESTCRGCAYENTTHFDISDSLGLIKLEKIITTDNSSPDMAGGSISKDLILVPVKKGITTFKLYKFWNLEPTTEDSAKFTLYTIDVQN